MRFRSVASIREREKKLILTVALIAVFTGASLAAIAAGGIDHKSGSAGSADSSVTPARTANPRPGSLNQEPYPDYGGVVDDWRCDGMTPCIELSPR